MTEEKESTLHDEISPAIREVIQHIYRRHGVMIVSLDAEWIGTSSIGKRGDDHHLAYVNVTAKLR